MMMKGGLVMAEIIDCICCWYDLLGFGKPFIDSEWRLDTPECENNITRIENLANIFGGGFSVTLGKTLSLNDGVIKTRDFIYNDESKVVGWLRFIAALVWDFERINYMDKENGFPGVRGVITFGKRFYYDSTNASYDALKKEDVAYHPREFQMNTAFSKAYIMEESGSKMGLEGSYLFWDKKVFEQLTQYINNSTYHDKFYCKEYDNENEHIFEIGDEIGWALRCFCEKDPIEYSYRGIKTKVYKMVNSITQIGTPLYG